MTATHAAGRQPGPDSVTSENWTTWPHLRSGFQRVRELVPTACIGRGDGPVSPLPAAHRDLDGLEISHRGGSSTLAEVLEETYTDGFIAVHRGKVVYERYFNGMRPDTLHLLQSVSKSICGSVFGIAVDRGFVEVDRPLTDYLEELRGTGWDGASVRDVLDMRTGTRYDETYDDPDADVVLTEELAGWRPRRADREIADLHEQIRLLENVRPHGERWEYRSILTDVLGWALERATGVRYPELVSSLLWSQIGAEHDADITITDGLTLPDGGISASLRDLARFGLVQLNRGVIDGRRVISREWVDDTRHGDDEAREAYSRAPASEQSHPGGMYRNQWWVEDSERGRWWASGIHGQAICIDVEHDFVGVKLSTWPVAWPADPHDPLVELQSEAFRAVAAAVQD